MRKLLTLLAATALVATLGGCAQNTAVIGGADTATEIVVTEEIVEEVIEETTEATPITVVLDWSPNTNHTGLYVALENGYYAEAGLDVEIVQPPEDGATALVAAGKAEFGVDFQDYLAPAFALGEGVVPVTTVAALIQHNTSGIISLEETGIESPADLAGHNYATWSLPVEQAMIARCMENDGADFAELELLPTYVADVVSALSTKMVDSVWVFYGWDGIATQVAGLDTNYFAFSDIEPAFDYYTPVLVANDDFLASNSEAAEAFMAATEMGYEFAVEQPEEAAQILLKHAPELSEELVVASQIWLADQYIADASQWGIIDDDRWNDFYDYLWAEGLIEAEIPAGYGYTNDFLPQ